MKRPTVLSGTVGLDFIAQKHIVIDLFFVFVYKNGEFSFSAA